MNNNEYAQGISLASTALDFLGSEAIFYSITIRIPVSPLRSTGSPAPKRQGSSFHPLG
jgi:hypothetical protein